VRALAACGIYGQIGKIGLGACFCCTRSLGFV
jgi:hypothetical protein